MNDLQAAISQPSQDQAGYSESALCAEGKSASEAYTRNEYLSLCRHLSNDNGKEFAMGFRDTNGQPRYTKNKTRTADSVIVWCYDSTRENHRGKRTAFAPYSRNHGHMSRWGALDFDGHGDTMEIERGRQWAWRCWQLLLNQAPCVMFEHSGRGWHVWVAWRDFKAASWINDLLRKTALEAGCEIVAGKCEIFPETAPTGLGKAMRAPGSLNPSTGRASLILYENLRESEILNPVYGAFSESNGQMRHKGERKILYRMVPYRAWSERWSKQFAITSPNTRNHMLVSLTGEMFHQVGFEMAELLVGLQFDGKHVTTRAERAEHMNEFRAAWEGLENRFVDDLTPDERTFYKGLRLQSQRDKFRIIRSFAKYDAGLADFPISMASVQDRMGEKCDDTASRFRTFLVKNGVIRQVSEYVAGRKCGRYQWLK